MHWVLKILNSDNINIKNENNLKPISLDSEASVRNCVESADNLKLDYHFDRSSQSCSILNLNSKDRYSIDIKYCSMDSSWKTVFRKKKIKSVNSDENKLIQVQCRKYRMSPLRPYVMLDEIPNDETSLRECFPHVAFATYGERGYCDTFDISSMKPTLIKLNEYASEEKCYKTIYEKRYSLERNRFECYAEIYSYQL